MTTLTDPPAGERAAPTQPSELDRRRSIDIRLLLPVIALACAVTVANIYLGQPLLTLIADGLNISAADAGWVATVGQLGYMLGLLFILPLGDAVRRRPLLIVLSVGTAGSLVLASGAQTLPMLLIGVLAASAFTIIPQLLVPLAASLVPPERRGTVVGIAFGGLFGGIVASRAVFGLLGDHIGWRTTFLWAAAATVLIGLITVALLPGERGRGDLRYGRLLASLIELLRTERTLRQSVLLQSFVFITFTMLWTGLVFLFTGAPYHFAVGTAGLLGLLGLTGPIVAPLAGRLVDRIGPLATAGLGILAVISGAALLVLGRVALSYALIGIAVLTAGVPAAQVANQSRVLLARPDAANRMNTVYLVLNFFASMIGAALATMLYGHAGWSGLSLAALGAALLGGLAWLTVRRAERVPTDAPTKRGRG